MDTSSPVCALSKSIRLFFEKRLGHRWGRNYETLGEEPLAIARLGAAVIRGLQGCDSKQACDHATARAVPMKLAAVAKHAFAYNLECSSPDTYPVCGWSRHSFDAVVSARDLNTSYLRQWRDAVDAGLSGAMCSYNAVVSCAQICASRMIHTPLRATHPLTLIWGRTVSPHAPTPR